MEEAMGVAMVAAISREDSCSLPWSGIPAVHHSCQSGRWN